MARKMLSGVLAFAMVFGCTAPVALAEAPVTEIEEIEQYALYNPSFNESELSLPDEKGAEVKATIANAPAKDVASPSIKITDSNDKDVTGVSLKATVSDDGATVTIERITENDDPNWKETFTVSLTYAKDDVIGVSDKTISVKVKCSDAEETKYTYTEEGTFGSTAEDGEKFKVGDSKTFLFYSVTGDDDAKEPAKVTMLGTNNWEDYLDVEEVVDSDSETKAYKVTAKKSNINIADKVDTAVKLKFDVQWGSSASDDDVEPEYTFIISPEEKTEVNSLSLKVAKKTIAKGNATSVIAQATKLNEYNQIVDYDDAPIVWYINGEKMDLSSGSDVYENAIGKGLVEVKKVGSYSGNIEVKGLEVGTYTIMATDEDGNVSTTAKLTVEDNRKADYFYASTDDEPGDASDVVKKVLPDSSVDLSKVYYYVSYEDGAADDVLAVDAGATLSYEITQASIGNFNTKTEETLAKIATIDENGLLTMAASDSTFMKELMAEYGDSTLTITVKVTAEDIEANDDVNMSDTVTVTLTEADDAVDKITMTADGEDVTLTRTENTDGSIVFKGSMIVTAGENVAFAAKVLDDNNFSNGIDQRIIWTVDNTNVTDDTVYATVDAKGVVTPLVASSNKCVLTGVSVADPDYQVEVKLYIVGNTSTPTPTAAPTAAPTTAPTAAPTAEPEVVMGKVDASSLNVRSGAGTSYDKVGTLKRGAVVVIMSEKNGWYEIATENVHGWVSGEYIDIIDDEPEVTETATTTANLRLRKTAPSGTVLTTMPKGATVKVLEKGSEWSKVEYKGKVGYASNAYLDFDAVG